MKNEAGLTKRTAHPRLRLWARPLRGHGGWVGDWYVWHAPGGLHVVWGNRDGTVSVVDLVKVQQRLAEIGLGW